LYAFVEKRLSLFKNIWLCERNNAVHDHTQPKTNINYHSKFFIRQLFADGIRKPANIMHALENHLKSYPDVQMPKLTQIKSFIHSLKKNELASEHH
jgi:hypothetical protein